MQLKLAQVVTIQRGPGTKVGRFRVAGPVRLRTQRNGFDALALVSQLADSGEEGVAVGGLS